MMVWSWTSSELGVRMESTVTLVTGGGRGIGRHAAVALARAGSRVCVTARSNDQLQATVELIREAGGAVGIAVAGDACSPADVARTVLEAERRLGPVDVLVNCAGAAPTQPGPLAGGDVDDWWRVVEVNVRAPMLFASHVIPGMVQRGRGRIINLNSLAGIDARTAGGGSAYGVSKAALFRLTDVLAAELAGTGVAVLDFSPGLVRTAMTADNPVFADVPDDQWTDIEAAAEAIVELAAGRLDALTGRFIHVADDMDGLEQRADGIVSVDARVLKLRTFGTDDPLHS